MDVIQSAPFGGFLLSEANGYRSRENIIVVSGQKLAAGTVIGKITTGGKWAVYDNALSGGSANGTEAAAGILLGAIDATDGDQRGVAIVRDAEVKASGLIWKAGVDQTATDAAKAAGATELAALNIRVRS